MIISLVLAGRIVDLKAYHRSRGTVADPFVRSVDIGIDILNEIVELFQFMSRRESHFSGLKPSSFQLTMFREVSATIKEPISMLWQRRDRQ